MKNFEHDRGAREEEMKIAIPRRSYFTFFPREVHVLHIILEHLLVFQCVDCVQPLTRYNNVVGTPDENYTRDRIKVIIICIRNILASTKVQTLVLVKFGFVRTRFPSNFCIHDIMCSVPYV